MPLRMPSQSDLSVPPPYTAELIDDNLSAPPPYTDQSLLTEEEGQTAHHTNKPLHNNETRNDANSLALIHIPSKAAEEQSEESLLREKELDKIARGPHPRRLNHLRQMRVYDLACQDVQDWVRYHPFGSIHYFNWKEKENDLKRARTNAELSVVHDNWEAMYYASVANNCKPLFTEEQMQEEIEKLNWYTETREWKAKYKADTSVGKVHYEAEKAEARKWRPWRRHHKSDELTKKGEE